MFTEYEIQRCTRRCAATGRELTPGEEFYSVLVAEGSQLRRRDYSLAAWTGPPAGSLACWKSRMPDPRARKPHLAPNDVMIELFEQLQAQLAQQDMAYVLALLLVRRRVMRLEQTERDGTTGREVLVLYCPRNATTYRVPVVPPEQSRIEPIQEELTRLLFARAA